MGPVLRSVCDAVRSLPLLAWLLFNLHNFTLFGWMLLFAATPAAPRAVAAVVAGFVTYLLLTFGGRPEPDGSRAWPAVQRSRLWDAAGA